MVCHPYPTESTQGSARERQQSGSDESSMFRRKQGIVGLLSEGPESTGGTPRLYIADTAHVHMENCQKLFPLDAATFCMMASYLTPSM